jgi:hypothetical protein
MLRKEAEKALREKYQLKGVRLFFDDTYSKDYTRLISFRAWRKTDVLKNKDNVLLTEYYLNYNELGL